MASEPVIVQRKHVPKFRAYRYQGDGVLPFDPDDMGYKYAKSYGCVPIEDGGIRFGEFLSSAFPDYAVHTARPGDWVVVIQDDYYNLQCEVLAPDEFEGKYRVVRETDHA